MTLNLRHYSLLALVAFLLALPGRMMLPPLDRDEPRYMEASEQMLLSHNFIDVRFQDKPRYLQPAGIYWLEAASTSATEKLFGPSILRKTWPYRIPSLLAATIIVPMTAWIGATLFGGTTGLMAAGLLMVSTLFVAESHMATIDTVLLLDILSIEAALLRAFMDRLKNRPTPLRVAVAYWLALGVGLMLKGPVVFIPGFGTPLALWLMERDRSWWTRLRPRWGWLIMLAVVIPWCLAIEIISGGDFFARAVGRNFLGKVAHGQEAHGLPPGFHLLVFGLAFWPGSLFAVLAIPSIWQNRKLPQVRFLLSWIVPHWLVFELIATKLPHYVLPTYPAIAILAAAGLMAWPSYSAPRWAKILFGLYGVLWALIGLVLCLGGSVTLYKLEHSFSLSGLLALGGSLPLLLCSIFMLMKQQRRQAAFCAMGAAVIAHAGLFLGIIPQLQTIRLSPRIAELFEDVRPCTNSILVSSSYSEPSLVFLVGPDTQLIGPAEAADYLHAHSQCSLALIDRKDEIRFRNRLLKYGLEVVEYGRVQGVNYSNGHHLDLGLFAPR
ncbi:ArnT family glycosyltransferase [Gluconobacter kanchanaburiensis]|uniref:Glycosyl transferase n=1 Tax=Gluconobacter kanchanaburiensis NBRC 103587 TaxID=1307948 RepID=A0A511B707_9PROT|nr:glycosyltransferase family 39 protein [Gluconobacter kanchanaburiensis]MBF0861999.1 glycosyltransferase family 39 protein [Gluconobacter kanchanaburiensis]GBR67646.1 glycosyltransferase [Gluconobacter kanchanaburiensis NBRC 103587]GEK95473.1 glycosyl transferase [Gluconobacter kanchanaburiensis NBRC 103587]